MTRFLRPRLVVYALLLLVGSAVMTVAFARLQPVTVSALRMTGAPYYRDGEMLRNNYYLRLINKSTRPAEFLVSVEGGGVRISDADASGRLRVTVAGNAEEQRPLVLLLPAAQWDGNFNFTLTVARPDGKPMVAKTLPFLGPYRSKP